MSRKDVFDEFAEMCVFEDEEFGRHLEHSNDCELARRLAVLVRREFGHGYDRLQRSSDPLDGLDTP